MSRGCSSPNPVSGKGTNTVHCRRPLVSAELNKRLLGTCRNYLDGGSCFIRTAQHWLLLPSFAFLYGVYLQPVFIYSGICC